jgi:hypothetical protein
LFQNRFFNEKSEKKRSIATYRVLLLLDLNDRAVLESPLDNVGLLAGALDVLRRAEGRPELGEVLDLDEVPDVGERGADDGRLADGGGGGDGRHCERCVVVSFKKEKMCCWYWKEEDGLWCILCGAFVLCNELA